MVKNYFDLTGRVAVVIGGTSGLGRTIAMGLGEAGATVVPTGRRQELADEVAAYCASKAGVLSLTRSLAVEWAKTGVNVNAIAPGVFRTELNAALLDGTERGREFKTRTPMGRFGKSEELIGAALLLSSDAASYMTGQCIAVDGGFLASGVNT